MRSLKGSSILALVGAVCAFAFPALATEVQAFASLAFGDSSEAVSRKIRAHLDDGSFSRECYKCPVLVAIGRYHFQVEPEFDDDRLWRISVRYALPEADTGRAETLVEPWELLRGAITARYGASETLGGRFPVLPAPEQAERSREIVTNTWARSGKRLDLEVSVVVEPQHKQSLRDRILGGLFGKAGSREERAVRYAVAVLITDPAVEARLGAELEAGKHPSETEIQRSSELF